MKKIYKSSFYKVDKHSNSEQVIYNMVFPCRPDNVQSIMFYESERINKEIEFDYYTVTEAV